MCSDPQQFDGNVVACRACNACISTRKNDWVARAMAEKHVLGHALVITMTYRDYPDGSTPPGAKVFHYQHVQTFLKRVRNKYFDTYKARNEISYICAGEMGSKKGRVHWHLVIFSKRPLIPTKTETGWIGRLGQWWNFFMEKINGPRIGVKKAMDHWDLWEHGTVNVLEPDQRGMAYVLKYALKDQFNSVKSRRTMRFAKSEKHAASFFRMSKKPPIGARFLYLKLEEWKAKQMLPVAGQIKVPGYSGYWYPKGKLRDEFLNGLNQINQNHIDLFGKNLPQWVALNHALGTNSEDWETLNYGSEVEERRENAAYLSQRDADRLAKEIARRANKYPERRADVVTGQDCNCFAPCGPCLRGLSRTEKERYAAWAEEHREQAEGWRDPWLSPEESANEWVRDTLGTNPFCAYKGKIP